MGIEKLNPKMEPRPCERPCTECKQRKHVSRFNSWVDKRSNLQVTEFSPRCLDCEQKERNEKKNLDRPLAIIRHRAQQAAHRAGVKTQFFLRELNWMALVERFRTELTIPCRSCGHTPRDEADLHIDHILPPRSKQDWANLHARNLGFFCGSCNRRKSKKEYQTWLDEQEDARLSNLIVPSNAALSDVKKQDVQGSFRFD